MQACGGNVGMTPYIFDLITRYKRGAKLYAPASFLWGGGGTFIEYGAWWTTGLVWIPGRREKFFFLYRELTPVFRLSISLSSDCWQLSYVILQGISAKIEGIL
jgi:hypothetical protein